ncbi:hypothetical protein SeMB42_g03613 [Synchytrium endobioticum]|uniref:Secreted protein n=1 Tax=Synchytrium endobioticum TaxID=286115 RepID=A0A507D5P4_9FUNG|nr:hypothetical protein SeMB42_g03613 [Synchytrium endobioticum]
MAVQACFVLCINVIMRSCHCCNRNTAWGNICLVSNRTSGVSVAGVARRLLMSVFIHVLIKVANFHLVDVLATGCRLLRGCFAPVLLFALGRSMIAQVGTLSAYQLLSCALIRVSSSCMDVVVLLSDCSVKSFFAVVPTKASEPFRFSNRDRPIEVLSAGSSDIARLTSVVTESDNSRFRTSMFSL